MKQLTKLTALTLTAALAQCENFRAYCGKRTLCLRTFDGKAAGSASAKTMSSWRTAA